MSNIYAPKGRVTFPGLHKPTEAERQFAILQRQCAQWRSIAAQCNPGKSADLILTVQQEIIRRANKLGEQGPVSPQKIAEYLLKVSTNWLFANTPVEKIMEKIPKTLDDLGYLIMREGAPDSGQKLTASELKRASVRGGKLIQ